MKKIFVIIIFLIFILSNFITLANSIKKEKTISDFSNILDNRYVSDKELKELNMLSRISKWTFTTGRTSATNRPIEELCGLIKPDDWKEYTNINDNFDPEEPYALPEKWDWREEYDLTQIRDQESCGSCWAFATVAPLESIIKINTGRDVDLSEQWLVSCNKNKWDCYGGWWAHDYHYNKEGKCGGIGAVLEIFFRYQAEDLECRNYYPHSYLLKDIDSDGYSWNYISESEVPSVESIKNAIYKYGPISAGVYVSTAFRSYKSGVFNAHVNETATHAITLTGWNDNLGANGVWFLRNSWGKDWGENGYMKIEYGCCNVGSWACYIEGFETTFKSNFLKISAFNLIKDNLQKNLKMMSEAGFEPATS